MSQASTEPRRLVVFGVTGQLGQEFLDELDDTEWSISELVGVASSESAGTDFDFRGLDGDVTAEWPVLKGYDLVVICTRGVSALEIVRDALKAEVPCLDLTGALAAQTEVPLLFAQDLEGEGAAAAAIAPLLAMPSATALATSRILTTLQTVGAVVRAQGTVLSSAATHGRKGVLALSQQSIALFNQTEEPVMGPAGQTVAFDVIPGGGIDVPRVRAELGRWLVEGTAVDFTNIQVPTFVGEGISLALEFAEPVDATALVSSLELGEGLIWIADGLGSRGLAPVEEDGPEPVGPTLRDAAGSGDVLVGRLEPDETREAGISWRLWLSFDPIRLSAAHATRIAGVRLGLS